MTVSPQTRAYAKQVELTFGRDGSAAPLVVSVPVDAAGRWWYRGDGAGVTSLTVRSPHGGVATRALLREAPPLADAVNAAPRARAPRVMVRQKRQQPRAQ